MNRKPRMMIGVTLGLLLGAGFLLHFSREHQRVGIPGVKVGAVPTLDTEGRVIATNSVVLPDRVLEYTSRPIPVTAEELGWLPPDTVYGRRRYTNDAGYLFDLGVVLMGRDRTSIHKPQFCLLGQGWAIERSEIVSVPISSPHPYDLSVMRLTISHAMQRSDGTAGVAHGIFAYWFVADQELTADHTERMWWMARDLIFRGILQRWGYVTCMGICAPGGEDLLFGQMKRLMAGAVPEFQFATGPQVDRN